MPTTSYSDLAAAQAHVQQLTSLTPPATILEFKLTDSAGTNTDGDKQYRIYYVSAKLLQQSRQDQALKEADQVVFSNLEVMIASLFAEQLAVDTAYGWVIPPGMSVQEALGEVAGMEPPHSFSGLVA